MFLSCVLRLDGHFCDTGLAPDKSLKDILTALLAAVVGSPTTSPNSLGEFRVEKLGVRIMNGDWQLSPDAAASGGLIRLSGGAAGGSPGVRSAGVDLVDVARFRRAVERSGEPFVR